MAKSTRTSWIQNPSGWVIAGAGLLLIIFIVAIVREVVNGHLVRQQVTRLRQDLAAEQQRQQRLSELISYLNSPTFQEQEARLKLGLKRADEQVVIVPPPANRPIGTTPTTTTTTENQTSTGRLTKWWNYFFANLQ
jgi:hypothetical protein